MSLWKGREMCLRVHKRALPKLFRSGRILWLYQFKMYRKLFIKCLPVAIRCLVHELIYFFIHSFMYLCIYYFLYLFIYYIKHIYNTLRSQLVSPKEKTSPEKKTGVVYNIACRLWGALHKIDSQKLGETERTPKKQTTSAVSEHQSKANHEINWEENKILNQELACVLSVRFCLVSEQGKIYSKDRRTEFSVLDAREIEPFFPSPSPLFYQRHFSRGL